jgi:hypothetical protein
MGGYRIAAQISIETIFFIFCLAIMAGIIAVAALGKETQRTELKT